MKMPDLTAVDDNRLLLDQKSCRASISRQFEVKEMTDVDLHKAGLGKMTDSEKLNYMPDMSVLRERKFVAVCPLSTQPLSVCA